jgi:hypothetical protein
MKQQYDNMPEDDKMKYIMADLLQNQKSDAKDFKNLIKGMKENSSRQESIGSNRNSRRVVMASSESSGSSESGSSSSSSSSSSKFSK